MNKCEYCAFSTWTPCKSFSESYGCKSFTQTKEAEMSTPATPPEHYNTPRSRLLNEVMEIVHKDRNANYGNPEDNFSQIASLWTAYWQAKCRSQDSSTMFTAFDSADVAIMNMLIKVARLAKNPNHHDSAVDIAGYAACLADIQESASKVAVGQAKT